MLILSLAGFNWLYMKAKCIDHVYIHEMMLLEYLKIAC